MFEEGLAPDEEIAAYLSSFGTRFLIQIEEVGYHNPYLVIFYGRNAETGHRVQLVQHCSQLSVLFTALKVNPDEGRKPRRIGFQVMQEDDNDEGKCQSDKEEP